MSDTLNIFGTTYNNVAGIISTTPNDVDLTFVRPQGTKQITQNGTGIDVASYAAVDVNVSGGGGDDIPVFTTDDWETYSCNKTYAECLALFNNHEFRASLHALSDTSSGYVYLKYALSLYNEIDEFHDDLRYVATIDGIPVMQINYRANGTILISTPPDSIKRLTVTSNGTYTADNATVWNEVEVNVPSGTPTLQTKTKTYTPTTSQQTDTVTADSGYDGLEEVDVTINAVPQGLAGNPTATKGTVSNHAVTVTPSVTNTTGYIEGGTKSGTGVSVSASELVSGTKTIDANGTSDVTNYASVDVDVQPNLQTASATPSETAQTITPDAQHDGLSSVSVGAIPSTYVGSGVTRRSSTDLTASGATVTAPAGYYASAASKSVASGTAGTPSATKGTVSNHQISVTPSVTNTAGYISGGTKTGTAVTVSASELVSGNKAITDNGTNIDVANYSTVSVAVPFVTVYSGTGNPSSSLGQNGDIYLKVVS